MCTLAVTETFSDVDALIHDTCNKFRNQYGGVYAELLSEAHECYLHSYQSFDDSKSLFSTWLRNKIWWRMLDYQKGLRRRRTWQIPLDYDTPMPDRFDLNRLLFDLSDDAAQVARIALRKKKIINAKRHQHWKRNALAQTLADLGWGGERILSAFKELTEALS